MKMMKEKIKKEPVLIIMAAGLASRYGGSKQTERMTEAGDLIIDFSIYDAWKAGFKEVILVIREKDREVFRELIDDKAGRHVKIRYAYQRISDVPHGTKAPEGRTKPLGTVHAVWVCKDMIDGPFAVINADDYYGPDAFVKVFNFLEKNPDSNGLVAYKLKDTVTDTGSVSRGICVLGEGGVLKRIHEIKQIAVNEKGITYKHYDGSQGLFSGDEPVSMNFWGFSEQIMSQLEEQMEVFLKEEVKEDPMKMEILLPEVVDDLLFRNEINVHVMTTEEQWHGVTYKEDKEKTKAALEAMKATGQYPQDLWG